MPDFFRILVFILLLPALAQAQPTEPTEQPQAKALYEQGVSAADRKDWAAARIAFLKAWDLFQHYEIAANLAKAEFELNRYRDAAEHLDFSLKNAPDDLPAEERRAMQERFDQARSHIGELLIDVNMKGADIFVDHSSVGKAPLGRSILVEPGKHRVEAKLDGYPSVHQSVDIEPGSAQLIVQLTLEKRPAPAMAPPPKVLHKENVGPNKTLMIAGWSMTGAGAIVTAVSAGFSVAQSIELEQRRHKNCADYADRALCEQDYDELRRKWALSTNVAINAGIVTGLLLGGTLAYTFWPWRPKEPLNSEESKPISLDVHLGWKCAGATAIIGW